MDEVSVVARGIRAGIVVQDLKIFYECELSQYLEENTRRLRDQLESETEDHILNVNETDYIRYLTEEFSIDNIVIDFDGMYVTSAEEQIPKTYFPNDFHFRYRSGTVSKQVIKYHLPFTGDPNLLRCRPSAYIVTTYEVTVEDGSICFNIINFYDDTERIKGQANERIDLIRRQHATVAGGVSSYNSQLKTLATDLFQGRKQRILKQRNLLASLGVPIRKRDDVPQTFAIPTTPVKRQVINKPSIQSGKFSPEPTLDMQVYNDILKIIYDFGKALERLPATYHEKDEEALRDHFLMQLGPWFEGGATGETFNKSGKTDILIRHENKNAFVAECKFWAGAKQYMKTISQLLGYLTWRDSKAAVILFVRNKEFSLVLQTIEKQTEQHENYLGFSTKKQESWFNFRFHLPGDKSREVKLAVIAFHIPSSN